MFIIFININTNYKPNNYLNFINILYTTKLLIINTKPTLTVSAPTPGLINYQPLNPS